MSEQNKRRWLTIVAVSLGIILGVGVLTWMTQPPPLPAPQAHTDSQHDQRLVQLEQAVTALTQALHARQGQLEQSVTALTQALRVKQENNAPPAPTRVTAPAPTAESCQGLAQLIREEIRQALADESPESQRAREEALVTAQMLNTPENRVAYQSASDVVHGALAVGRWTEDDKQLFRAAFMQLTNDQRMELMNTLAPAINRGEIAVEVSGPLF